MHHSTQNRYLQVILFDKVELLVLNFEISLYFKIQHEQPTWKYHLYKTVLCRAMPKFNKETSIKASLHRSREGCY